MRRLVEDRSTPLSAALRAYAAQDGDSATVLRLERRLAAELTAPVRAPARSSESGWLFGVSMVATAAAFAVGLLALALHAHAGPEAHAAATRAHWNERTAPVNAACYLGTGPRDLANAVAPMPMAALYAIPR